MKLTSREIDLLAEYTKSRQRRKIAAWLGLIVSLLGLALVLSIELIREMGVVAAGMVVGAALCELVSVYFRVRPEDKLIDLLQRYINADPEAIRAQTANDSWNHIAK